MLNQIFQIKLWMIILSIVSSIAASSLITYVVASHKVETHDNAPVVHYCPTCPVCPILRNKPNTTVWKDTPLPSYRGGKSY